jgi:hypothetical protein
MAARDGKRKVLSLEQRMEVIRKLESGKSCRAVAAEMGCGKTQIQAIAKDREQIKKQFLDGSNLQQKYIKRRKTGYEDLNQFVWEWYSAARSKNIPLTGKMLQEKAIMLSLEMGLDDFTASNGWLHAFQVRHNIRSVALSGESADVSPAVLEDWQKRLPDLLRGYNREDVFNADETGLFYRALPQRTLAIKGDPAKGTKTAKDRITVLLACSAAGEKLTPLVIGKSKNPRCFQGKDKGTLPVQYRWNKKAWMTSDIFSEWLDRLNSNMKNKKRHILLFLDNCGAHPDQQRSNIKVVFLPPNTTSKLQPCDAGIIQNVKLQYRKALMRNVIFMIDSVTTASEVSSSVTMLNAIRWLDQAWSLVHPTTIQKCFIRCGFRFTDADIPDEEPFDDSAPTEVTSLLDGVSWKDYINCDSEVATQDILGNDWEEKIKARARGELPAEEEEEAESDDDEPSANKTTSNEAVAGLDKAIEYAEQHGNLELVRNLMRARSDIILTALGNKKSHQMKISSFAVPHKKMDFNLPTSHE